MTPDFVLGQLRLALVAFLSFAAGKGWITPNDSSAIAQIATALGPILIPVVWSWLANWQKKYVPSDTIAISSDHVVNASTAVSSGVAIIKSDDNSRNTVTAKAVA